LRFVEQKAVLVCFGLRDSCKVICSGLSWQNRLHVPQVTAHHLVAACIETQNKVPRVKDVDLSCLKIYYNCVLHGFKVYDSLRSGVCAADELLHEKAALKLLRENSDLVVLLLQKPIAVVQKNLVICLHKQKALEVDVWLHTSYLVSYGNLVLGVNDFLLVKQHKLNQMFVLNKDECAVTLNLFYL
jgi:hypothetical protein